MARRPPLDIRAFEAAVSWFRQRTPVTDEEYAVLRNDARNKAFTVAGVAQLDVVADVYRALETAIANKESFETFRSKVEEKLTREWGEENPTRVKLIFTTNVQLAYGAGRYEQMTRPENRDRRPWWRYEAVLDGRATKDCRLRHGTVRKAADPWWKKNFPPRHFRCRCAVVPLENGSPSSDVEHDPAEPGFRDPPKVDDWEPKMSDYPKPLAEIRGRRNQ